MISLARSIPAVTITALLLTPSAWAGHSVGNGGDAILCREAGAEVHYALDYVLTSAHPVPLASVASLDASLSRIRAQIAAKLPELLVSFDDFADTVRNESDYSRTRVWERAPYGLMDLSDENILAALPDSCKQDGRASIVQAVHREWPEFSGVPADHIIYKYVPSVFDALAATSPAQLSFLVVHEWLWDISRNVERNRRLNRFLHSTALESLSRDEAVEQLRGMGVVLPDQMPDAFREDACLPEVGAGNYWKDRYEVAGRVSWRDVDLFARRRSIESQNQAGATWRDINDQIGRAFASRRLIMMTGPWQFDIVSSAASGHFAKHTRCRFDRDGRVSCSALQDTSEELFLYQPRFMSGSDSSVDFQGVLSRGCLKLEDKFWYSGERFGSGGPASSFLTEDQVVLWSDLEE